MFEPDRPITRADVAQIFYNLLNNEASHTQWVFPDVESDSWYYKAVNALTAINIVQGYPDGNFYPNKEITRAEFVALAVRFTNQPRRQHNIRFSDVSEAHWAYEQINTAICYGWITGYENGFFAPERFLSRAEAVTIVNRMLNRHPDMDYVDRHQDHVPFSDVKRIHWAYYNIMEAAIPHKFIHSDDEDADEIWVD